MVQWFEELKGWSLLIEHCQHCSDKGCGCKVFAKHFGTWSKQLPSNPSSPNPRETWLWFSLNEHNRFRWRCLGCHVDTPLDLDNVAHDCQISNLLRHHESPKHRQTFAKLFNGNCDSEARAPSKQIFIELLLAFQKGEAPSESYKLPSGIISVKKANMMLWCLSEAGLRILTATPRFQ